MILFTSFLEPTLGTVIADVRLLMGVSFFLTSTRLVIQPADLFGSKLRALQSLMNLTVFEDSTPPSSKTLSLSIGLAGRQKGEK